MVGNIDGAEEREENSWKRCLLLGEKGLNVVHKWGC